MRPLGAAGWLGLALLALGQLLTLVHLRPLSDSWYGLCWTGVILVGDAPYYARFGFARRHTVNLAMPGWVDERRFLGLELAAGALKLARGMVRPSGDFAVPAAARAA